MRISDWSSDVCSSDLYWNKPEHITKWCQASDDWHAPYAENDLRDGGKFKTTIAAKDGSFSFDFEGVYDEVAAHSNIAYTIEHGRKVNNTFSEEKRSETNREGKECVSTGRSQGGPYHEQNKINK